MSLRELFLFTNKEKRGLTVLLLLLVVSALIPLVMGNVAFQRPPSTVVIPLVSTTQESTNATAPPPSLFAFNPNELDSTGWLSLGFTPTQVATVLKYRSRGGYFRQRDDLLKLYFIDKETYLKLREYIQIDISKSAESIPRFASLPVIDINEASEEEWKALPGIGEVLSKRIVAYRNSRGGFDSITQLLEVYGIQESWLSDNREQLQLHTPPVRLEETVAPTIEKVDVNRADSAALDALPGIGPFVAQQLVAYRNRLGGFRDTAQLREVKGFREQNLQRALPHLTIGAAVQPLSLSTASQQELADHPYIGAPLAAFIVSYRMRHGGFTSVDELLVSYQVDAALLEKLRPYIVP